MKKAQMEVFGIAIVAVLIIVLLLLTAPSAAKKAPESKEIMALTSMLSATFDCNSEEKPVMEFIKMCPERCSCAAVAIDYLLPLIGKRYSFGILKDNQMVLERNTAECNEKSVLLPSGFEARLGIC